MSGYTPCACRDCMDIAISNTMLRWGMCAECLDAGCEPCYNPDGCAAGSGHECQRDDAYGAAEWPCKSCTTECYCTADHDADTDCVYCDVNAEVHCP